jgi:hypothetical protein
MSNEPPPIHSPAGYVARHAIAFAGAGGRAVTVDGSNPLPVTLSGEPTAAALPLTGLASTNMVAGPFRPTSQRPIMLTLAGQWSGTVQLVRSVDEGVTRAPLTIGGQAWGVYGANCNEPVWEPTEPGATFYLDISLTAGAVSYRVAQ